MWRKTVDMRRGRWRREEEDLKRGNVEGGIIMNVEREI